MFQGNVLSKVFKVRSKIFAICKCFFLQTHWLLQRTSTNTATSDNIAKYISKPKSQARIHLSSQYWNTQGMRIRTHHHSQRVWTDPIFCTIRNCNWGHWLPHSWAHSWQDGQGGTLNQRQSHPHPRVLWCSKELPSEQDFNYQPGVALFMKCPSPNCILPTVNFKISLLLYLQGIILLSSYQLSITRCFNYFLVQSILIKPLCKAF